MNSHRNPFDRVEEALGMSRPTPFNFDSVRTKKDGNRLVGELVDAREFTYDGRTVPEKVIRTQDGAYRSVALWPPQDGQEEFDYHLRPRWEAATPEIGDYVAIQSTSRSRPAQATHMAISRFRWCVALTSRLM